MITAAEAIRVARSKLGTPYGSGPGQLDCINLVKFVIRNGLGGDPSYTDAHVPALWASYTSSGRYKHLTAQQIGIDGALPGMLAFKGQPLGRDNQPSHVGIVSYDGKVIHASSAKGEVVETELANSQWTLLGVSRWIQPAGEDPQPEPTPDPSDAYSAQVIALHNDKPVNLRSGPSTSDGIITKVPVGTVVDVLIELDGWDFIDTGRAQGYMASQYLKRCDDPEPSPEPEPDPDPEGEWLADPVMISDTGAVVRMDGRWRMAID